MHASQQPRASKLPVRRQTERTTTKPRRKLSTPGDPLSLLRSICLALPEAHEVEAWGTPTFRVRNKLFAMYSDADSHHGEGRPGVWVKSTSVNQDLLIHDDPDRFFKPPYVGPSGWVGIHLDKRPNWKVVAEIIADGYSLIAPKRLRR